MKESTVDRIDLSQDSLTPKSFGMIVEYLYTDNIPDIGQDGIELLMAVNSLGFVGKVSNL